MHRWLGWLAVVVVTVALAVPAGASPRGGTAGDCCGGPSSWTTGDKSALGTAAAGTAGPVWFTVANGVTSEVFYPRADVPNMQDMQYVVTDGSSFTDLERDATTHVVSMPDERALEYTVTNTARSGRYRITTTYVTDPSRATLLTQTRFQSLDGGKYQLFLLANPSMAGGAADDTASWSDGSLLAGGGGGLAGPVSSALRASTGFTAHDTGYSGAASDCLTDLRADHTLTNQYDAVSRPGNVVQCGQIPVGTDTTFTVALGYGASASAAVSAASASLAAGFPAVEGNYRQGWHGYLTGLGAAPASVAAEPLRQTYDVAAMALHAAEDKTHPGASVAGLATPWGDRVNGDQPSDGYHRVWGRDLYEQATGLLAAGDTAQPKRMAQFMWHSQWIGTPTAGDGTTYQPGSFPRYSPVSGISGATPKDLGCCEQLDQDADAIVLAWTTGLTDPATYAKIKTTANHIQASGPATTERWEEQQGRSPSSVAAEIAGLVTAGAIARANGDTASAASWESTADSWRTALNGWTVTTNGHWGQRYYERIDPGTSTDPNDNDQICFQDGCFYARDVVDYGFLEQVRLGERPADDPTIVGSLAPTAAAADGNAPEQVALPNGDVYYHRYPHDSYGESNADCSGWPANGADRHGRLWPVLSGERGEYELAAGRPATAQLRAMADAANDGHFVPEQIWDRADVGCFGFGRPTGSAAPLMWAEGQFLRLARSIDAGHPVETPSVVAARYGG